MDNMETSAKMPFILGGGLASGAPAGTEGWRTRYHETSVADGQIMRPRRLHLPLDDTYFSMLSHQSQSGRSSLPLPRVVSLILIAWCISLMPIMSLSSSDNYKRRKSITNAQRRALRTWFFNDTSSPCSKTHMDASTWWEQTYGYHLNSSTVSEILSYKYAPLDQVSNLGSVQSDRKRDRAAKWEQLEEELYKWVQLHQTAGHHVSDSLLRHKATELWHQLPCYFGLPCPKWSEGWKTRFKARHNMQRQRRPS